MKKDLENCLSCKFFRLDDMETGVCRIDKETSPKYPSKKIDDQCPRWKDCGQQYYIRIGWIKSKKK